MDDSETTLLRMNEQGVTTIPSEVREVLDIDGKRAILRVKDIEVAKITEDPPLNQNQKLKTTATRCRMMSGTEVI